MNPFVKRFIAETEQFEGRLCSPNELFDERRTEEELLDVAVIGGYGLRDILEGKVQEFQIPAIVKRAFHAQYPHAGGFVEFVRERRDDSQLIGIVSAIKGKVFELEYVDYLDHGHVPKGAFAELASSPTQQGWDIAIRDSHGLWLDCPSKLESLS